MIKELVKRYSGETFFVIVLLERHVLEQDLVWRKPSSLGDSFLVGGLVAESLVEDLVHKRDDVVSGDGTR